MTPPIGTVCGVDVKGNYKVRSHGTPRLVILTGSNKLVLRDGDEVQFEVDQQGEYVDFSRQYSTVTESPKKGGGENRASNPSSIELVLRDTVTRDVLILGIGDVAFAISRRDVSSRGEICGRNYALLSGSSVYQRMTVPELARAIGVSPEKIVSESFGFKGQRAEIPSTLPYVDTVPGTDYRTALEARITELQG